MDRGQSSLAYLEVASRNICSTQNPQPANYNNQKQNQNIAMATPNQLMVTAPETLPVSASACFTILGLFTNFQSQQTPILFKIEGMEPDTQLQVFHQTFLVHSSALKLHSTYFRKFLDSPDKPTTFTGKYWYSWVTKLDGNGPEWSLVSDHTMEVRSNTIRYPLLLR